jgi:PAS domain-containing protein
VVIDAEGLIISLNRTAEALFGIEAGDGARQHIVELFAEESNQAALD